MLRISCLSLGVLLLAVVSCALDESQALKGGSWLVVEVARHVGNCLARAPRSEVLNDASPGIGCLCFQWTGRCFEE